MIYLFAWVLIILRSTSVHCSTPADCNKPVVLGALTKLPFNQQTDINSEGLRHPTYRSSCGDGECAEEKARVSTAQATAGPASHLVGPSATSIAPYAQQSTSWPSDSFAIPTRFGNDPLGDAGVYSDAQTTTAADMAAHSADSALNERRLLSRSSILSTTPTDSAQFTIADVSVDADGYTGSEGSFNMKSPVASENYGRRVISVGDFNNDSYADFAIGGYYATRNGVSGTGEITVVLGQPGGLSTSMEFTFPTGPAGFRVIGGAGEEVGRTFAGAGDVNNDGCDDFIVAVAVVSNGGIASPVSGAVVIFGHRGNFSDIYLGTFTTGAAGLRILWSDLSAVAIPGDMNGDGYADVAVTGSSQTAYIIYGRSSFTADVNIASFVSGVQGVVVTASAAVSGLSWSGDINNDGYSDVLVLLASAIYLVYGSAALSNVTTLTVPSTPGQAFRIYGGSLTRLSGVGDINGDGFGDFAVANPAASSNAGVAFVLFGKSTYSADYNLDAAIPASVGFKITGVAGTYLGSIILPAGDVNADGIGDLLVTAPKIKTGPPGIVYIIFGRNYSTNSFSAISIATFVSSYSTGIVIKGTQTRSCFGCAAVGVGDLTGNGLSDVVIGAYMLDTVFVVNPLHSVPTSQPSAAPTSPTSQPSRQPSSRPSAQPTGQPSRQPSAQPSRQPTSQPTRQPSSQPSRQPSRQPTGQPSRQPSRQPTSQPTRQPTGQPTNKPSSQPSRQPTSRPSGQPSRQPTSTPTGQPSGHPSARPSGQPSSQPSRQPSSRPSVQPSAQPSSRPSSQPSTQPSVSPSRQPSGVPTTQPTAVPTAQPSIRPTRAPSAQPSGVPSEEPIAAPSSQPSALPTAQPSAVPSAQPNARPSGAPSGQPSSQPSSQPYGMPSSRPTSVPSSSHPSSQPSSQPSAQPTSVPSAQPSAQPMSHPTALPSSQPSSHPSSQPSIRPSSLPSAQPSSSPSAQPVSKPSAQPSSQPSSLPTVQPSSQPSIQPSGRPSAQPSSLPSSQPTGTPSVVPSSVPSAQPSAQPSSQPSTVPSSMPSSAPTSQPSSVPSAQPSPQPSTQPTGQPSSQPSSTPSILPSAVPSAQPSSLPSTQPSRRPTVQPSSLPSSQPTGTPSVVPSSVPSAQPSAQPSSQPSTAPSSMPSSAPTSQPSSVPSAQPSAQPSTQPTGQPSSQPSSAPSGFPSAVPSAQPSALPSAQPSRHPTVQPSAQPSTQPSSVPSGQPSGVPLPQPSGIPSTQPSARPSTQPSAIPSSQPSSVPSCQPSAYPSVQPSTVPSTQPSAVPTSQPTTRPSSQPSAAPSAQPSAGPSSQPSSCPTAQPSRIPSSQPSSLPSTQPSGAPSSQPSSSPTAQPSGVPSSQPTCQPSSNPSAVPTVQPSSQPSALPSAQPTCRPSTQPSSAPSSQPSGSPSAQPSAAPSVPPSSTPSAQPSSQPSTKPSSIPSSQPSASPTMQPTAVPTAQPSIRPSAQPSATPSAVPSGQPSSRPSVIPSGQPSANPSAEPSAHPSALPTSQPSVVPSTQPTSKPSTQPRGQPSTQPSSLPSSQPSTMPSGQPSPVPSSQPSAEPSSQPSSVPSSQPSCVPSAQPSTVPSSQPSSVPSVQPSVKPSSQPSTQPSSVPSTQPTGLPSALPSSTPTSTPSCAPSSGPTSQPSSAPTTRPSCQPTGRPSAQPTSLPTSEPSGQPTAQPSGEPTAQPSCSPSVQPTAQPSAQPSSVPTDLPTSQPSAAPSSDPSGQPSAQPTGLPSAQPSVQPSIVPTSQPTGAPTSSPSDIPSAQPSPQPTTVPSTMPSGEPTTLPSAVPSARPSLQPFAHPTAQPTSQPVKPTHGPTVLPSLSPTMKPSSAGSQVFFDGVQFVNGVTAAEFMANGVVVEAWKATVALACDRNKADMLRVDVLSVDNFSNTRRLLGSGANEPSGRHIVPLVGAFYKRVLAKAARVNFTVTYTQQEYDEHATAAATVRVLKANYEQSVLVQTFNADFVTEVQKRTTDSQEIVDTVLPAAVVLAPEYQVIETTYSPSYKPTISPRPTASPSTRAPTLYWKASTVTAQASTFTSGTISLDITFTPAATYPGQMYCIAMANNGVVTSVDQVVSGGTAMSYLINAIGASLVIQGLDALTPYATYCYIETAQGVGNSFEEVQQTRLLHTTACCKALTFTNAPASLYGDSSKYPADQTNRFVFSYALGSAPIGVLDVTPTFVLLGGTSSSLTTITASPATTRFVASSAALTGSFIISVGAAFPSGDYNLTLQLSGTSSAEYPPKPVRAVVHVLAADAPPDPPVLQAAVFSSSGGSLLVTFDSATNQPLSTVPCVSLFVFDGAAKATCTWTSNTNVRVKFPAYDGTAFAEPSQLLQLIAGTVKAQCYAGADCTAYAFNSAHSVTIAVPSNPVIPAVVISMPRWATACTVVTVDASLSTGHGGRPWQLANWTVRANVPGTSTSALQARLNSLGTTLAQTSRFTANAYLSTGVEYTISLMLRNFLGQSSSASVLFTISSNPNLPIVQILGSTMFAGTPMSPVTIFASSGKSVCAEKSVIFSTTWAIYSSNNTVVNVRSTSVNPYVLLLPAFSLSPGNRYRAVMTTDVTASDTSPAISASAEAYITVSSGSVVAVVSGGDSRLVLPSAVISIDASNSYDENVPATTTGQLTFLWTCTYLTKERYGTSCGGVIIAGTARSASLSITGAVLSSADTYSFTVKVTAPDQRSASKAIILRVQNKASSTSVAISGAPAKISANQRLSLTAQMSAKYGLTGVWSASSGGSSLPIATSTPASVAFSATAVASGTGFALLLPANQLSEGSTVTFRLNADRTGSTGGIYQAYSEVSVLVNAPPTSGTFAVTPTTGEALTTSFDLAASGWTDDTTDLPLSYMFQFVADAQGGPLVIQSRQSASTVSALLPAGSESQLYAVTLTATIYDSMLASTNTTQLVLVTATTSPGVLDTYIADGLNVFQATHDINQATLMVNNVATTINVVNCSSVNATFCHNRNRHPCSSEPGTCSSCLDGYVGVVGNSNAKCLSDASSGAVGKACSFDSDCTLGSCTDGVCIAPAKLCPSSDPHSTCSGNGACVYTDSTGTVLDQPCTIFDTQCFATCACTNGTAGYDCSLTPERLLSLDTTRNMLCSTFLDIAALSNPSAGLLETSVQTLLAAFDVTQTVNSSTVSVCVQALQVVSALAATDGILGAATTDTVTSLVQLAGQYARTANATLGWDGFSVDASMANITSGVLSSMVNGQTDITVATTNVKFVATKAKTSDLTTLKAPLTIEEQAYGVSASAYLELTRGAGEACDAGKGYVDAALTQWGINPFPGVAGKVEAAQMKFESSIPVDPSAPVSGRPRFRKSSPAYFVTLAFNQPQNLTLNVPIGLANVTFPECTEYDPDSQLFVPCGGCEVSTFTNNNVTFVCYDITRLCGTNATIVPTSRRLAAEFAQPVRGRALASNDDYLDDADGWGAQTSITSIQYTALVSTFVNVLSTNIFRINWRAAKATISVVAILIATIVIGLIYFRSWDVHDHNLFLYKYKELPHQRLKKINHARSIKLKARSPAPAKGNSNAFSFSAALSLRRLDLQTLRMNSFARQPTGTFDIWDDQSEEKGTDLHDNPMKRAVSYDPVHESLDSEQDVATIEGTVDSFIRYAIPIRNLDGTPTDKITVAMDILRQHPVFNLFFEANLQVSRVQRFIQICIETLCGLFVDTLFFSTFYPSDGECEGYNSEESCLEPQNSAVSTNLCTWSANANVAEGGACTPQAPPQDVMFMMILVMITLVITVPLSFVFDFVLTEYCSKRPDFDEWGYSTENLLGRSTQSLGEFTSEKLVSPIVALRREVERSRAQLNSPVRFHSAAYLAMSHPASERDQKNHTDAEAEGRATYHELIGVQEEVDEILRDAIKYLTITVRNQNVPWKTSVLHGSTAATALLLNKEKVRAIERELGVRSDATPMPLSIYDRIVYGSQTNKLLWKIRHARMKATLIHKTLDELGESELLSKDQALTQFFILEQFSVFKQYALRSALFSFSVTSALPIDPTSWILGWMFIVGALTFFVYWILAWGINTADVTIGTWGVNFAIGTVQELFLIQTFRLYVIYMISTIVIKPQLAAIYRTLQRLAIEYIQDELPDGFGVIKVVQHVSPACRVAKLKVSDGLAAGQILRQIDDSDIHSFRRASHIKLPIVLFTFVAIPVIAGLLNDATGDITLNSVLPSAFSMIILGHVLLWQINPLALIMPYVAIIIFLLTGGYVFNKAQERVQKMRAKAEARVGMNALAGWQKRYRTSFNTRMTYWESFAVYVKTHAIRCWTGVLDTSAAVVYYTNRTGELRNNVLNAVQPTSPKSVDKRSWRAMNMPDFLHGRVICSQQYAATLNVLSKDRIESPELPERVMRMTADVASLWAEQGSPAPLQVPDNSCSGNSHSYMRSLLTGEDWTLLAPAPISEQQAEASPGQVLQTIEHTQAYIGSPVAARFKEKYGFHFTLDAAVCKVLKSFQEQLRSGSLYFLSLEDQQQLISAVDTSQVSNPDAGSLSEHAVSLLQYPGKVHVRDVALMLEEILYFYRPSGAALTTAVVKDVLIRYDEWVVGAAEPLDLELLTTVSHLLNCGSSSSDDLESDDGVDPYSSIVERGHFQQHQLVSLIHFGKLAKELKSPSPVTQSPRRSSMARAVRVSSTWSDIRIVLDDEAARLREAETGIMSAALRSLSGKQKLSIASRMEAKKRQERVKVHIAHATVPFDAFANFLRAVLLPPEDHTLSSSTSISTESPLRLEIVTADEGSPTTGDLDLCGLHN